MCLYSLTYLPLYWEHQRYVYMYTFIFSYISPSLLGTRDIYLCVYSHLHISSLFTGNTRDIFMRLFSATYLPLYWEHQRYIYAFILIYISPFLFGTTKIYLCVYSHLHTSLFTRDNRYICIRLFSLTYLPLYLEHLDIFMCLFSPTFSFHFYWEHHRYIYVFIFTKIVSPLLKVHIREYVFVHVFSTYTSPIYSIHQRIFTFV